MAMDFIGLSVGMGYTDETVIGGGALKGKNCVVRNIEEVADGVNVTFQWTLDNGTVQTETVLLPKGTQGEAGADGKSAYQYAKDGGYIGTETEFTTNIARSGVISKELEVERARIDNLTTLQDGSTTGDAELLDIRVGYNGKVYESAGESVRGQANKLLSKIENINPYYNEFIDVIEYPLEVVEYLDGKYYANSNGVAIISNMENYNCVKLLLPKNKVVALDYPLVSYFSYIVDDDMNIVQLNLEDFELNNKFVYDFNAVSGGKYLLLSAIKTTRVFSLSNDYAFNSNISIYENEKIKKLSIPSLYDEKSGKLYSDLFNHSDYNKISHNPENVIITVNNLYGYSSTQNGNIFNTTEGVSGFKTPDITMISPRLKCSVDVDYTTENIRVYLGKTDKSGNVTYSVLDNITKPAEIEQSNFSKEYIIDTTSLSVYENISSVFLWVATNGLPGKFIVNNFIVYECSILELSKYYNQNFIPMMENITNELDLLNSRNVLKEVTTLHSASGEKFQLQIGANNSLIAVPHIPNNVLVLGNSLVFGWDGDNQKGGSFGMASTNAENDYFHIVKNTIKEKNPDVIMDKLYSSPFEHSTSIANSEEFIRNNIGTFTNRDLVIIQMGDNVNTDIKQSVFVNTFPVLLQTIRTNSPNARVLVVGEWFKNAMYSVLIENSVKYGCLFVDISGVLSPETIATIGDTVTYIDGSTTTINSEQYTHPSDEGMRIIANNILSVINM